MPQTPSWPQPYGPWRTRFSGQVAIITGSSSGIGLATALRIVAEGGSVVLNGRGSARLRDAQERVSEVAAAAGGTAVAVAGDAADESIVASLVAAATDLGGLHIAIANAGGGTEGHNLAHQNEQVLLNSYRGNVVSAAILARRSAAVMVPANYGRIVTVSSGAGRRRSILSGPEYTASKAALIGLTRHLAHELAPSGVTVNSVAPGLTMVPRLRERLTARAQGAEESVGRLIPLGRWGCPEDQAAAICFLASSEAGFITGTTVDVDGGLLLG